jgi:hypothetical protein
MYLQVKAPASGAGNQLNVEVTYRVMKGNDPVAQSQELITQPGFANVAIPFIRRLPVNEMKPGQYELVVTVKDRATGQAESRRTQFQVEAGS